MLKDTIKHDDFLVFEKFERTRIPALICLFGPSGSGKSKSAVQIAIGLLKVLGGKALYLDTETGRGKIYAKDANGHDFTYSKMTPPFTPERYAAAIRHAERAGFDHLIIDSASHEWDGLGGMLDIADARVDSKGKPIQGKAKWSVKSRHKMFVNTMMAGRMNIIICLRAKDRYVKRIVGDKEVEVIEGFLPLQERNFKYDMMIQLPMPEGGKGRYLLDETLGFKCPGEVIKAFKPDSPITIETGEIIAHWINEGISPDELLRQMELAATEEAEQGVDHFRAYWKTLDREKQIKLHPFLPNLESIAKTADAENSEEETPKPGAKPSMISSLMVGLPQSNKAASLDNADWLAVIDDLEPKAKACATLTELNEFMGDYSKQLASIMLAPADVKNRWESVLTGVLDGLNKAA